MTIQHLRSSTANKRPTPAAMSDGQLAVNTNTASPGLFFKDSAGALIKVGPVHVGTTAPNASPASGGETGNTVGEQWLDTTGGTYVFKVWDGSAWRSESGTFVDVNGDVMTGALGIIAGSAGSPGLYFSGDTNTGLYSPGADQVAISTGGSGKLFVDASGNVTVDYSSASVQSNFRVKTNSAGAVANAYFGIDATDYFRIYVTNGETWLRNPQNTPMAFHTNNTERLRITSAGLVGVGTSSPTNYGAGITSLSVNGSAGGVADFYFNGARQGWIGTMGSNQMVIDTASTSIPLTLKTNNNTALTIDTSQRVGIGTSTPGRSLELGGSQPAIKFNNGTVAYTIGTGAFVDGSDSFILWKEGGAGERLRVDSSGRLLVGTSSARGYGDGNIPFVQVERATIGGDIANIGVCNNGDNGAGPKFTLAKSRSGSNGGVTVVQNGDSLGSIQWSGADGTDIESVAAQITCNVDGTPGANDMPGRLVFSVTADGASSPTEAVRISQNRVTQFQNDIIPGADNAYQVGQSGRRWSVVFAGTGTINTSDANLKQDIEALEQAELNVAAAIKGLVKKFRFIDAVEAKGGAARIHIGVIAQEVEQAFIDEGLDPRRYAMFCEDTVEDGSKRLGIRYDELLAFVIAAL